MNYLFNKDDKSLKERICQINNIDLLDLDVSDFEVDYDLKILNDFKETLLSYKDKRFFIVGDYDCDGICATAIIKKLLDDLNIANNYYIPSRTKQGYGLNIEIVDNAIKNNFGVLLCVDNGVVAYEQLNYARNNGLKTLIIDHHEYEITPDVDAFLHPNLFDKKYEDMCASGLCALLANSFFEDNLYTILGGIATLADMVKVLGYNRYLIKKMYELLDKENYKQIKYLLASELSYESLIFNVIPKINAISRLQEDMNVNYMVKYLLNYDNEADKYINTISLINDKRKDLSKQMYNLGKRLVNNEDSVLIIKSDRFVEGICGLVANRLMNEYGKPVIVLSEDNGLLKGSGRSINGSNLYEYLKVKEDLFETYGGHPQAIGLTLSCDKYEELLDYIKNNEIDINEYSKDVLVYKQEDINLDLIKQLDELKPFGSGFNSPLFAIEKPEIIRKIKVSNSYPKYVLSDEFEAISFNRNDFDKKFEYMIGSIQKDNYHNNKVSMIIEELL